MFDQIVNDIHFKNFRIIRIKLKKNFRFCFIRNKRKTQFPLDIVSLSVCVQAHILHVCVLCLRSIPEYAFMLRYLSLSGSVSDHADPSL